MIGTGADGVTPNGVNSPHHTVPVDFRFATLQPISAQLVRKLFESEFRYRSLQ